MSNAAAPSDTANLEGLEYPFLTMKTYPPGFIVHLGNRRFLCLFFSGGLNFHLCHTGGTVSARSVKLLDRINNSEEPETRDNWWTEIRMEVRSHARALGCSVILGYEEHTSIWYCLKEIAHLNGCITYAFNFPFPAKKCAS